MKCIITTSGTLGPFSSVEATEVSLIADGQEFPLSVIGEVSVLDWVPPVPAENLGSIKTALANRVDASVADVYSRWLRFDAEYVARETAARAFLADGTPSVWISGFASPAGMTEPDAAALIVAQADSLRDALQALGALRMEKYKILAAPSGEAAHAEYERIIAHINEIAEAL